MLPVTHWWTLRKKFMQSIPGTVTPTYLASVLNMKEKSARDNVHIYLKQMKIIDKDGKPLPRATKWRDDHEYKKVCENIVKEIYPQELCDAAPDPDKNNKPAKRWFASQTGGGEGAVKRMVACYTVLRDGDVSKAPKQDGRETKAREHSTTKKTKSSKRNKRGAPVEKVNPSEEETEKSKKNSFPEICINLQVHISSDASTDQIDQIFASMAKHIYPK